MNKNNNASQSAATITKTSNSNVLTSKVNELAERPSASKLESIAETEFNKTNQSNFNRGMSSEKRLRG